MTTCDEVREKLPEHVLGTLEDDLPVRRHLRGCAGCRGEMAALGEGVALFARAVHDRTPPAELKDRVATALAQEWGDSPVVSTRRYVRVWLPVAAALLAVSLSLAWGMGQRHRAVVATAAASSYDRLLGTLGGKEFRVGTLRPGAGKLAEGSVVIYESSHDQSWVALFVRAPGVSGQAVATLTAPDGRSLDLWPMTIAQDGAGSAWLVTATNLSGFDHVAVTAPDGSLLATAQITRA